MALHDLGVDFACWCSYKVPNHTGKLCFYPFLVSTLTQGLEVLLVFLYMKTMP